MYADSIPWRIMMNCSDSQFEWVFDNRMKKEGWGEGFVVINAKHVKGVILPQLIPLGTAAQKKGSPSKKEQQQIPQQVTNKTM